MKTLSFHWRNAQFAFLEAWTNLANSIVSFLLFPVFMFVLAKMWQKFNGSLGNYTYKEILAYIGVTEVLFLTFLKTNNIHQASTDFSLSLARPRSWLMMQFSALFGKTLGTRLVMSCLLFVLLLLFGLGLSSSVLVVSRLLILIIPLGIMQALYSLMFSSAHVRWEMTNYMVLPFAKLFLVFGGVFAPLSDFSEPARSILLNMPASDIFFQPAYFCIKGFFYQMSMGEWSLRIVIQALLLIGLNALFFKHSRKFHQSFGG